MIVNTKLRAQILVVQNQNKDLSKKDLVAEVYQQVKEDGFYTSAELEAIREEISERVYNS